MTHQQATNNNKVLSALFLDVKGAFDHVSLNQLLKVMKRLHLPQIVLRWVQCFLTNRSITLAFGERNQSQSVNSGIPQGSPISPMLFLIYIRFLFTKINNKHTQLKLPSYIDDVAIIVEGKTAKENSKTLELVTKLHFNGLKIMQ
jgi:retron-type reverse transcriptase